MDPEIFREFAAAFIAERNTIIAQQNAHFEAAKLELGRVKLRQKVVVNALADGLPGRTVKDEIIAPEAKEDDLTALLANQPASEPSLYPNLAEMYRERIGALHAALADPRTKDEAFGIIRTLIDEVRLIPEDGQLRVKLRGALAGILALANNDKNHLRRGADGSVSVLVEANQVGCGGTI